MSEEGKRCMTHLDAETVRLLTDLRAREERSESKMISILVREALEARIEDDAFLKDEATAP